MEATLFCWGCQRGLFVRVERYTLNGVALSHSDDFKHHKIMCIHCSALYCYDIQKKTWEREYES